MRIRRALAAMAVVTATLASTCACAQDWPSHLVRIVVPAAPGGSSDAAARLVTNHFQTVFRQPFIIENKPGNGNALGAALVAQAEPDGYTLLSSNSASNLTVPLIAKNAGYDPVADFSHILRRWADDGYRFAQPILLVFTNQQAFEVKRDDLCAAHGA
jgi:tripartite-type tricarboxylate transporter receptor subunit TctC